MSFAVGDRVRLNVPANGRLHGTEATVRELADWGAHVLAPAAGSGHFRAGWDEMEPIGTDHAFVEAENDAWRTGVNGNGQVRPHPGVPPVLKTDGATGEMCPTCGGAMVRRGGPCARCENCGTSGGCG